MKYPVISLILDTTANKVHPYLSIRSLYQRFAVYKHVKFKSEILNRSPPVRLSAMLDPLAGSRAEGCISAFYLTVFHSLSVGRYYLGTTTGLDITEDRSCHQVEWSENILCGGHHLI